MDFPFHSDWCSCSLDLDKEMRLACLQHDFKYWQGGSYFDRLEADQEFQENILKYSQYWYFANDRYYAVRVGGTPFLPTPFRFGYGWQYPRWKAPKNDKSLYTREDGLILLIELKAQLLVA